jgi:hypothetical protein
MLPFRKRQFRYEYTLSRRAVRLGTQFYPVYYVPDLISDTVTTFSLFSYKSVHDYHSTDNCHYEPSN